VVGEVPQVDGVVEGQRLVQVAAPPVPQGERPVVTETDVSAGAVVRSGSLVARVADRPVLLLALPVPPFRDLHHGDSGSDVTALQRALRQLGHYGGPVTGVFGPATEAAVRRLYLAVRAQPRTEPVPSSSGDGDAGTGAPAGAGEGTPTPTPASGRTVVPTPSPKPPVQHVWLPLGEIAVLPAPRAVVVKVAARGSVLPETGGSLATLRIGGLRVRARVPVDAADLFAAGTAVTVAPAGVDPAANADVRSAPARVAGVGPFRPTETSTGSGGTSPSGGAPGADLPGYDVTVDVTASTPVWLRQGAKVVVRPAARAGRPTLAVPLVAVRQASTGPFVLKDDGAGRIVETPVRVLADAEGWAAVEAPGLAAGDRVRVDP
jgi:peptidoglycan hydrolase-like protein with peptidoglycan-binding domain